MCTHYSATHPALVVESLAPLHVLCAGPGQADHFLTAYVAGVCEFGTQRP